MRHAKSLHEAWGRWNCHPAAFDIEANRGLVPAVVLLAPEAGSVGGLPAADFAELEVGDAVPHDRQLFEAAAEAEYPKATLVVGVGQLEGVVDYGSQHSGNRTSEEVGWTDPGEHT